MKKVLVAFALVGFTLSCTKKEVAPTGQPERFTIYADSPGKPITILIDNMPYGQVTAWYPPNSTIPCDVAGAITASNLTVGDHALVAYDVSTAKRWEKRLSVRISTNDCISVQLDR